MKNVDLKIEVVVIPVRDVDRAKDFYGRLGWRLDADFGFDNVLNARSFLLRDAVTVRTARSAVWREREIFECRSSSGLHVKKGPRSTQ